MQWVRLSHLGPHDVHVKIYHTNHTIFNLYIPPPCLTEDTYPTINCSVDQCRVHIPAPHDVGKARMQGHRCPVHSPKTEW